MDTRGFREKRNQSIEFVLIKGLVGASNSYWQGLFSDVNYLATLDSLNNKFYEY